MVQKLGATTAMRHVSGSQLPPPTARTPPVCQDNSSTHMQGFPKPSVSTPAGDAPTANELEPLPLRRKKPYIPRATQEAALGQAMNQHGGGSPHTSARADSEELDCVPDTPTRSVTRSGATAGPHSFAPTTAADETAVLLSPGSSPQSVFPMATPRWGRGAVPLLLSSSMNGAQHDVQRSHARPHLPAPLFRPDATPCTDPAPSLLDSAALIELACDSLHTPPGCFTHPILASFARHVTTAVAPAVAEPETCDEALGMSPTLGALERGAMGPATAYHSSPDARLPASASSVIRVPSSASRGAALAGQSGKRCRAVRQLTFSEDDGALRGVGGAGCGSVAPQRPSKRTRLLGLVPCSPRSACSSRGRRRASRGRRRGTPIRLEFDEMQSDSDELVVVEDEKVIAMAFCSLIIFLHVVPR